MADLLTSGIYRDPEQHYRFCVRHQASESLPREQRECIGYVRPLPNLAELAGGTHLTGRQRIRPPTPNPADQTPRLPGKAGRYRHSLCRLAGYAKIGRASCRERVEGWGMAVL